MDFCTDDIKAHCLPNEFDITGDINSKRLSPSLNKMYSNTVPSYFYKTGSKGNRTTIQLKTYSSWFNNLEGNRKIFRINKSDIPIKNFTDISENDADKFISSLNTSEIKKSSFINSMEIQQVDRELIHSSIQQSLKTIKESLQVKKKSELNNTFFDHYLEDILYYYSASGYLDVFNLFSSGEKTKSQVKFNNLIDESISFFENLGRCMEIYE